MRSDMYMFTRTFDATVKSARYRMQCWDPSVWGRTILTAFRHFPFAWVEIGAKK